jgi:hydrogenase maturation protease
MISLDTMEKPGLLIFGYGNPSRGDDALGPMLLERLGAGQPEGVELLTDFQLQVEHALDLDDRRLVLFVDAHLSCPRPFAFTLLTPACDASYTTHAMSPAAVLQVYRDIRPREPPPSFLLSIRGERFELGQDLSAAGGAHLAAALTFVEGLCARPQLAHWLRLSGDMQIGGGGSIA